MANYDLHLVDLAHISTNEPAGFSNPGGTQFTPGTSTITISPDAVSQIVQVSDNDNATFDDDANQTLVNPATIDGTTYGSGTLIEGEYLVIVEDSLGNTYHLMFASVDGDPNNIRGFSIIGAKPPFGEALTVTGTADALNGFAPYASSSPACFEASARIETAEGPVRADRLRRGDLLLTACGGTARVALLLTTRHMPGRHDAPVLLRPGALGGGLPHRRLILSPQHRVQLPGGTALAPARALRALPRIGPRPGTAPVAYVHVVMAEHALIRAEGVACESFWPGRRAMAALPAAARRAVRRAMGPAPRQAAPFLSVQAARAALLSPASPPPP